MGGNALKEYGTVRLQKEDAFKIAETVLDVCKRGYTRANIIPSYQNKETFGDIDIIVSSDSRLFKQDDFVFLLRDAFGDIPMKRNGKVFSIGIPSEDKYFQVDLIHEPLKHYDFSLCYYSYNDLGNFIGRIAHSMGLKFGHDGLHYVVRDNSSIIAVICLTQNFQEAVEYLGYGFSRFEKGFDSLQDIFEFVTSSPLFTVDAFKLGNRSHIARVRDKKRANYRAFLNHLGIDVETPKDPSYNERRVLSSEKALTHFGFSELYERLINEHNERKKKSKVINGYKVMEVTGLKGKSLGALLSDINLSIKNKQIDVLSLTQVEIEDLILDSYKKFKNNN